MKDRETISITQMATLFFTFVTGSSMIVIPGPLITMAFNAAWLSILISLAAGLLLLHIIFYLHSLHPGLTFIAICRKTIGKWGSIVVACLMLTMALHMAAGITLDVASFMNSMMLPETPAYAFMGVMYVLVALMLAEESNHRAYDFDTDCGHYVILGCRADPSHSGLQSGIFASYFSRRH